ncbi:zinc metalloproteinase dpy-31-like [Homalodisca vitripennis]|uniref:zinc metalloproteinase dpy-31-like n=1 Tax=Homalodisca vitripennis TaxID=197043 RepID=UPI001EEB0E9F|nr:zinc metalloproteinase dpy-31-like [Homalodisca vitripennis]
MDKNIPLKSDLFLNSIRNFPSPKKNPLFAWIITNFTQAQENYIVERLMYINSVTCITWIRASLDNTESITKNYKTPHLVEFVPAEKGCKADVNSPAAKAANRWAKVYVSPECINFRSVVHQIGHAMGFGHEHQRIDRDCYVKIDPKLEFHPLLNKVNAIDISFPYDLYSSMHYRRSDYIKYAREGERDATKTLGRYDDTLSGLDIAKIEYRYCGAKHFCDRRAGSCLPKDKNGCSFKP